MFTRFDTNKSTKGASKLRRDLINAEIANLRDLLPLPPSTRQRLSQLQLMALVCVYVRKANYFQQAFKRHDISLHQAPTPNIGFSKALSGFLMMMTQNGKLLYISDNAAEYLGHSMEDLLIHGDSVYDIIDKQDHQAIQTELGRTIPSGPSATTPTGDADESRMFLCRMNVSRNARRQMRFGDQKVVLVRGHYLSFLPLCSRNEPVFLATCTPIAMPETRECVVQGATNVFTSIHSMDMKFIHIDKNGEFHLEYPKSEIQGASWYRFLHWESTREAQTKHRLITQSEQDRSCILLVRLQRRTGDWLWVHCVLQVKENMENSQQPVIVCTNQVLSEHEAAVMRANGWLYHYYMVQSKLQYGLAAYDTHASSRMVAYYHGSPQVHGANTIPPFVPSTGGGGGGMTGSSHHDTGTHHHLHHQGSYLHSPGGPVPQHGAPPHHHHGHHLNGAPPANQQQMHLDSPRTDIEPVDYSVHANNHTQEHHGEQHSSPEINNYNMNSQLVRSPPIPVPPYGKRKPKHLQNLTVLELEPLKINESPSSSPSTEVIMDLDRVSAGSSGILLMPTVPLAAVALQHTIGRSRLMVKAATTSIVSTDPADFMEQWNPSPPWSDTLQKVPDIAHQDLSPYVTTTPPTPTGTPGGPHSTSHTAFTFDWMPEQYVPSLGTPASTANSVRAVPIVDDDYHNHHEHHHLHHYHYNHHHGYQQPLTSPVASTTWPPPGEQRIFALQPPPATRSAGQPSPPDRNPDSV